MRLGYRTPDPSRTEDEKRQLVAEVCARIVEGELVAEVCDDLNMRKGELWRITAAFPDLDADYARARVLQSHAVAELALRAANGVDDFTRAAKEVLRWEGERVEDLPAAARNAARHLLHALESGAIQRDTLRVNTYKWLASKLAPLHYGDKVDVQHSGVVEHYVAQIPGKIEAADWAVAAAPHVPSLPSGTTNADPDTR